MRYLNTVWRSIGIALVLITPASAQETVGTTSQPLSVTRGSLWSGPEIPVCWEDGTVDADGQRWSREGAAVWEQASAVRFTGWGTCAADSRGIRIAVAEVRPSSGVGAAIDGVPGGMTLNLTFAEWESEFCGANRQYCITAIAAHEFGHALGAQHEQLRSDTLNCEAEHGGGQDGDWYVTPYDPMSIMNYCNPNWNGNGQLSDLDRQAIAIAYGKGATPVPGVSPSVVFYQSGDANQLETLFASPDGRLGLAWKQNNSRWYGPVYLSPPGLLAPDARIAVAAYPLGNQLEALYAGTDGAIYISYKVANGIWSDPVRLTEPGLAPPNATIALTYYPPNEQLEALFVGNDGAVRVLWKAQNGPWNPPVVLTDPGTAPAGGGIASEFYPLNNQLEALFIGNDGALKLLWKANNEAWAPVATVSGPNLAPPGGATALRYYPPNNQLEGTFIDGAGAISMIWKAQNGAWAPPVRLTDAIGVPGAPITLVYQPLGEQLEALTIGSDGGVKLIWKAGNGAWSSAALSGPDVARPGAPIAGAFQPLDNQIEVFFGGRDGVLGWTWKAQNGPWTTPGQL